MHHISELVMEIVQIKDKKFRISYPYERLLERIQQLAQVLSKDLADANPVFLCVLNGSFMFAADLLKNLTMPAEVQFVKLASYQGTASTGQVRTLMGLNTDLKGRMVVVIEDIVETGLTLKALLDMLAEQLPAEVRICTLMAKPQKLQVPLTLNYVAFELPNDFIVGYGLDYDGYGRNLPHIYTLCD